MSQPGSSRRPLRVRSGSVRGRAGLRPVPSRSRTPARSRSRGGGNPFGRGAPCASSKRSVERSKVLSGRTLPYGEGVTYWPLASMVKASAGITDDDPANEAFEKLRVSCESEAVADLLAVAL